MNFCYNTELIKKPIKNLSFWIILYTSDQITDV